MIKAITFDLDGVYFPGGKANFLQALGKLGIPEEEIKSVFVASPEMRERYKLGRMSDDKFWTWAVKEWSVNKTPAELIQLLVESYTVDERVANVVRTVRSNGYKTLICTNNFPARINGLQERFGFLDDFDEAVFSYEVGALKPASEIFAELIRKANMPAESIVFADDQVANVEGAKSAGLTAFIYKDFDTFLEQLKMLGVKL